MDHGQQFKGYYRLRINLYDDLADHSIASEHHFDTTRAELTNVTHLADGRVHCFVRATVRLHSCKNIFIYEP